MFISVKKLGRKPLFGSHEWAVTATLERESGYNEIEQQQLRELLEAMEAGRRGDLTRTLTRETEDIFGEIANSYNNTVELINSFGCEVVRAAREVDRKSRKDKTKIC